MALEIRDLRHPGSGAFWTSPARLCVTADGRVTDEHDPDAVKLLVAKGGQLPIAEARRYGLVGDVETKERKGAETKAPPAGEQVSPPPAPTGPRPLGKLNKAQLQEIADELGVERDGSNAEIIARIEGARTAGIEEAAAGLTGVADATTSEE